jgi:hypothetical protein
LVSKLNGLSTDTENEQHSPFSVTQLHSRYQPQIEADRYIEALNLRRDIDYFILIEPGLGYLIPALRQFRPESKIVVLHADNYFRVTADRYPDIPVWLPDSGIGVQEFLEEQIPEAASARIIEWRPSIRAYGDRCLELVRESTEFIKRSEASRRTGAVFGGRWARNFFRNLALVNRTVLYRTMDMPIVITGSGPSLEAALPQILAARKSVFVLAASSSLPALAAGGITPDMVISTDGGGWALLHLHACFRGERTPPLLACSLSAAIPSQCAALPLLPLNDGTVWQSMALQSIGIPSALVPQRGTVTASALELALALSSGSIFLAGMDLGIPDIRSHARPYGFDHLFYGAASRLRPVYSQHFIRSRAIKAGGSHDVYAAWFKNRIASSPARIFSIGGNHAVLGNSLPRMNLTEDEGEHKVSGCFKIMTLNDSPAERRSHAAETLIAALGNPQYAAVLSGELSPLLFPSNPQVPPEEIAETLRNITRRKCG